MNVWSVKLGNYVKSDIIYDLAKLIRKIILPAFKLTCIINEFKVNGILVLNEDVFSDFEFLSSEGISGSR